MSHQSELIATDIQAYLKAQEHKSLLRFITCGSVDDGKSTLIGRLLYESKLIYEDQLATLEKESKKMGTQGDQIDFALLVDGLAAEREQGITIDVAYRYFSTDKRKFIVADTPGHEQYTRNMATGASTADCAILMIDARKGVLTQTKRHSIIVHMLGVKQIVLAINKMDLVNFNQDIFNSIKNDYDCFAQSIGIDNIVAIPVSALNGDNITHASSKMSWYQGPTLIRHLESTPLTHKMNTDEFSMPVQWVNRPHLNFRGFAGQITTGSISVGDKVIVKPSGKSSSVKEIITMDGPLESAVQGQSITLTFMDEIDVSRGDVLVKNEDKVKVGHHFQTRLLWMSEESLVPEKEYWVKFRSKTINVSIKKPNFKIDVNSNKKLSCDTLKLNEIGLCEIVCDQDIAFESFKHNAALGSFIIIDRVSNNTVGMGLLEKTITEVKWVDRYVEQRDKFWERSLISKEERSVKFNHEPALVLLTGDEKTTFNEIAKNCEKILFEKNINIYRYGFRFMGSALNGNMNTTHEQIRQEMIKNLIEIGHAFCDAGMVFLTSVRNLTSQEEDIIKSISAPNKVLVIDIKEKEVTELIEIIISAVSIKNM